MAKVSVIIPVYNVSSYIERCARSLFEQTLDDMEFIFVDDCSKDNSIEILKTILDEYPHRRSQTKILENKQNRGVSYARQRGLDTATGEFVIHCDSDDWVDNSMYETLYNCSQKQNADIVCCGFKIEDNKGNSTDVTYKEEGPVSSLIFNIAPLTGSLVNKLIKRSILVENHISFPRDINWGEDFYVSICSQMLAKKIYRLSSCFYHYFQQINSITHSITKEKGYELLKVGIEVERFLIEHDKLEEYAFQLNYLKFQLKSPFLRRKEIRNFKIWRKTYIECHNDIMKYNSPSYLKRVAWCIVNNRPLMANIIIKSYDIYRLLRI